MFDENDGILYARDYSDNPDNGNINRYVLVDLLSDEILNVPTSFGGYNLKESLKRDNKRYNLFHTFTDRSDPKNFDGLKAWHWQEFNPYDPEYYKTYFYAETKEDAIKDYFEGASGSAGLLKRLVKQG